MNIPGLYKPVILFFILLFSSVTASKAYSVLAHEALIDASWDKEIKPLLKQRYRNVTDSQLTKAHAYAYGGSIIQDMGYYPLGSVFFTNLLHYVRSGDFVNAMLDEATDVNEYAFALGALCHYYADTYGHSMGTNLAVPIMYPKEKKKYGDTVTYAEDNKSHSRMEFAFDVLQTAKGKYSTPAYNDFIGFEVARPVLEKAFYKTYCMEAKSIFGDFAAAIGSYRWSVKILMPQFTKLAWQSKKLDITQDNPDATKKQYRFKMDKKSFYNEFGKDRNKPGFIQTILAVPVIFIPKVGPFTPFGFKPPKPAAEKLYVNSYDTVLAKYKNNLQNLRSGKHEGLDNKDFDTGKKTTQGEYTLADETYNQLLLTLQKNHFVGLSPALRQNILVFYSSPGKNIIMAKCPKKWKKVAAAIEELKKTG